jgi:hypothetical protein
MTPLAPTKPERILTLHPAGKNGVSIERTKYDAMRKAILACMPRSPACIALSDLSARVAEALERSPQFSGVGKVLWYLVTVKQDLEARGDIEIDPTRKPQHLRRRARARTRTPKARR